MSLRIPRGKPITASVLRDASFLFNAPIGACIAIASFVERSRPTRKTVLAAPPPVHRRLAPCASEAADINARLPFL